jgi:hypothetical protein
MYIKMTQGRYAGKVRDISNDVALDLINDGRATRAFVEEPRPQAAPVSPAKPAAGKTKMKGARK